MPIRFRLLTEHDVQSVLTLPALIRTMEQALADLSTGQALQPVRTVLDVGPDQSFFGVMPACTTAPAALGAKLVTMFRHNPERGLPTHLASIVLLDPETGALRALIDGRYITELRTAAVSAVSASRLAREDAGQLAIIGSGVQARSHLEALVHVRRLRQVRVWSPTAERLAQFVSEMQPRVGVPVQAASSAEAAAHGADLIVLATSSREPVLHDAWVAPGAHVMSVGACRPTQRELDPALTARARLFVDSRAAALVESGDVVLGMREERFGPDHIRAELGELVAGRAEGRRSPDEVTLFKSLGLAVEDISAAELVYHLAVAQGVGRELEL